MRMHRALFAAALSPLVALLAAPSNAQEAAATAVGGAGLLEATSLFAPVPAAQATLVPIRGVVSGTPESVAFTGQAKVASRLAPDPDFNRPRLVLSIDLSGVAGVGSSTGAKYAIFGPELLQREVAASYAVEITFPFKSSTAPEAAIARTGIASFVLDFDVNTGAVTRASGGVSTPNFPR